ncbi:uncharacterized protein LOC129899801 [Solanum dulcamara]|uniref:uncharacterized protein LOC129899801 n=1 Tax=Solanum dulcamara TaxID=45834 RepID=UPI002485A45F|nr:uncharacterized protein LOC129899801 [Solanum dulcamara]
MVQLLHSNGQFTGLPHEDPQFHIQNFLEINDTYTPIGVSPDYVRLTLFPFSLLGESKRWLKLEPPNSIIHGMIWPTNFLSGLEPNTKILLDSAAGGQALEKTYDDLYTLLNRISQGNLKWNRGNARLVVQKQAGMLEIDAVTTLTTEFASMQNMMTTHFNTIAKGQQKASVSIVQQPPTWCEVCENNEHVAEYCGANPESVNFMGNAPRNGGNQNYGNTYNPNWRNHPNFSWGGNQQNPQ